MIGHFPASYPDELFYSVLARCKERSGFLHHRTLLRLLFNSRNCKPRIDLPHHLDKAASAIPCRILGAGIDIAQNLTLLRFYTPFLHPGLCGRITEAMSSGETARPLTAVTPLRVGQLKYLRCCSKCWQDDTGSGRERYWRRSHQAPGVLLCHLHGEPLAETCAEVLRPSSVQKLVSAEEASKGSIVFFKLTGLNRTALIRICKGAYWLLQEKEIGGGPIKLMEAYRQALRERGLVRSSKVRLREACRFVEREVGRPTLAKLASPFVADDHNWLSKLVWASQCSRASQAPLRHLILMAALGHDAESFFTAMALPRPEEIVVSPPIVLVKRRSVCESRAEEIGRWWTDDTVSVSEMARRLGVATGTVGLFAAKRSLPFPRECRFGTIMRPIVRVRSPRRRAQDVRTAYLRLLKRYPDLSQTEIADRHGPIVRWLQKKDWEWLRAHRPVSRRRGGSPGIDWTKRDRQCAKKIPAIVGALRRSKVRVSLSSIGRMLELNLPNIYRLLPLTYSVCAPQID